jgi:hypothetical protein
MDAASAEMVLFLNADKARAIPSNLRTVPEPKKHPKTVHQHERMPRRLNNMGETSRALSISTQLKLRQQGSAFELTQDSDSDWGAWPGVGRGLGGDISHDDLKDMH